MKMTTEIIIRVVTDMKKDGFADDIIYKCFEDIKKSKLIDENTLQRASEEIYK